MRHRIRSTALIVQDESLLLVKHQHPTTGNVWWVPAGGGVEGDESVFECAEREVWEETGLSVELERIVCIREFVEPGYHHCELFMLATSFSGELTTENVAGKGMDEQFIKDARFLSKDEIKSNTVYPEMLEDVFWDDVGAGFPSTRYLGVSRSLTKTYL
jgi:ADP-ribose pyrophosphatase YjhB (NUDIX family)